MKTCYHCQKELLLEGAAGPEDACPYCGAGLHCCFNCRNYSPTASQQCLAPEIRGVKDKKAANDCEKFAYREFHKLTRENPGEAARKKWDDLFRNL